MDICSFGFNSYNGIKKINEDIVKVKQYQLKIHNNKVLNISYFGIFLGIQQINVMIF